MLGKGRAQTNSPTSPITGVPPSSHASIAAPRWRHWRRPGVSGSSGLPAMKAAAISVPPLTLHHQMSARLSAANCADPQRWTSGGNGDPVLPRARIRSTPSIRESSTPALRQLMKKAAPAPNHVTPACTAKRHNLAQSGSALVPLGDPSNKQMVVPLSSPPTWMFHITQPLALYQWKRSPRLLAR